MDTRTLIPTVTGVAVAAASWSAAAEKAAIGEGMGVLTIVFLGLGAVVILMQVIPALVMFGSMLVSLFSPRKAEADGEENADITA